VGHVSDATFSDDVIADIARTWKIAIRVAAHPRGLSPMTTTTTSPLDSFAAVHRLRVTRDTYNTQIIAGKHGSLITDYGDGRLTVLLMGTSARWWNGRRTALVATGCRLEQDGDTEGSVTFDPSNAIACALAIKFAGCKRRKVATKAQRIALRQFGTPFAARGYSAGNVPKTDDRAPSILSPTRRCREGF
jgi:hypothetical protein